MRQSAIRADTNFLQLQRNNAHYLNAENLLGRISKLDKTAINECLDKYGNTIWAMASNQISGKNLEKIVREIFTDIWEFAAKFDANQYDEETFIKLIAVRRLEKFKRLI